MMRLRWLSVGALKDFLDSHKPNRCWSARPHDLDGLLYAFAAVELSYLLDFASTLVRSSSYAATRLFCSRLLSAGGHF